MCSVKDKKDFGLDTLEEEINMLEKKLSEDCQDIGFCHNDLQYGNIMMDEETRSITIIVSFFILFFLIVSLGLEVILVLSSIFLLSSFIISISTSLSGNLHL